MLALSPELICETRGLKGGIKDRVKEVEKRGKLASGSKTLKAIFPSSTMEGVLASLYLFLNLFFQKP